MHGTSTYPVRGNKQAAINALFTDVQFLSFYGAHMDAFRNCAEWDALTCDEQMRLEDIVDTL